MIKFQIASLLALGVLVPTLALAEPPAAPATPAKPAAVLSSPVSATPSYPADALDTLHAHIGETLDITGTPTGTGHSKQNTVAYLNFGPAHKAVAIVAFQTEKGGTTDAGSKKIVTEDTLKSFVGKPVIVHGKLADYKGDLQIVLDSPDQIKLAPQ